MLKKGVKIPDPSSVQIAEEVNIEKISGQGVVLYPGTRILGEKTVLSSHSRLGYESPVTLIDCQLGQGVDLRGGFFYGSIFLDRSGMGSGAQVRETCIIEEEAGGNHFVGLKQTILFPFVTLGSLINFCDCLMAGGTSRNDHSEVGSSFIHFNYTPNQDKATPSLIGDVPRGVMLNQPPIFLGGQGGLVGPARIGFGTVTAAGTIVRGDHPAGGKLLGKEKTRGERDFLPGFYADIDRRVSNNILYLANLIALGQWYSHVRLLFFQRREFGLELYQAAMEKIQAAVDERLKRFQVLSENMPVSARIAEKTMRGASRKALVKKKRELHERWPALKACFTETCGGAGAAERDFFVERLRSLAGKGMDYISAIRNTDEKTKSRGTTWLQSVVDDVTDRAMAVIPSFKKHDR